MSSHAYTVCNMELGGLRDTSQSALTAGMKSPVLYSPDR